MKKFEDPIIQVETIAVEDVITASGDICNSDGCSGVYTGDI